MENHEQEQDLTDAQLAEEILKQKFLSAGQLKAALDYQASVGGRLKNVLVKLGLIREDLLLKFLDKVSRREEYRPDADEHEAIAPPVEISKLRIHRKLVDKVPTELVERYGILFFFPPPGNRAILMSCAEDVGSGGAKKLQELLGVDICPILLTPEEREAVVSGDFSGLERDREVKVARKKPVSDSGKRGKKPQRQQQKREKKDSQEEKSESLEASPEESPVQEILLEALVKLLMKKSLINPEELEVEIELLKHVPTVQKRTAEADVAKTT